MLPLHSQWPAAVSSPPLFAAYLWTVQVGFGPVGRKQTMTHNVRLVVTTPELGPVLTHSPPTNELPAALPIHLI